jgi:hypothetical protein
MLHLLQQPVCRCLQLLERVFGCRQAALVGVHQRRQPLVLPPNIKGGSAGGIEAQHLHRKGARIPNK